VCVGWPHQVVHSEAFGRFSEPEVLALAACAERGAASHPLAAAIVGRAAVLGARLDAELLACETVPGRAKGTLERQDRQAQEPSAWAAALPPLK
jgi:cation transport ATPase